MDRFWLLTWTTYGTWLPGDERGFVSPVRDSDGSLVLHNIPGTEVERDRPKLKDAARQQLKSPPIRLNQHQAKTLLGQFQETADYRRWRLLAVAVMANHVHIVTGVSGDPDPETILHSFKAYGSRALNRHWRKPASGTWWTESGSKRILRKESAVRAAIRYVREQEYPLVLWSDDD